MKGVFKAGLAALLLCFSVGEVLATDLPPVVVHGLTIDAVDFECRSIACADMLGTFGGIPVSEPLPDVVSIGSEGQLMLSKKTVCDLLGYRKPEDCSASSPPSVPGFDPGWKPNGCGTGGWEDIFYGALVGGLFTDHYSGDLDAPMETSSGQNVSFLSACNHHDECWARGGDRLTCDNAFGTELNAACGVLGGSDLNTCQGMASVYRGAVSSDRATAHYYETVAAHTCAAWAYDMRRNGCSS